MSDTTLPLFPLGTVLFPAGPLPLKIFETRYVDMIARCLRESEPFGVVLIATESEAGAAQLAATGCSARIVGWDQGTDGLLYVTTRGERRFRLQAVQQQKDGLNMAEISWSADQLASALEPEQQNLADGLERLLERNQELYGELETHFENAGWVADRLAELLPLPMAVRQRCLELDDPAARLELVGPVLAKLETAGAL